MYYASYGLNMDKEHMLNVCDSAEYVSFGIIPEYGLKFIPEIAIVNTGWYKDMAPVVVWNVPASSIEAIISAEGYAGGGECTTMDVEIGEPEAFEFEPFKCDILKRDIVNASIYVLNTRLVSEKKCKIPDTTYFKTIRNALKHNLWYIDMVENAYVDTLAEAVKGHEAPCDNDYYNLFLNSRVDINKRIPNTRIAQFCYLEHELQDIAKRLGHHDRHLCLGHIATNENDSTFIIATPYLEEDDDTLNSNAYEVIKFASYAEDLGYCVVIGRGTNDIGPIRDWVDGLLVADDRGSDGETNIIGKRFPVWGDCYLIGE